MQYRQRRTRRKPGPLLVAAMALALGGASLLAHDPGLSALDVAVGGGTISASLTIAAADAAQIVPPGAADAPERLGDLARASIRLSVGDTALSPERADVEFNEAGVRIRLEYAAAPTHPPARRLTVSSDLPKRMPRGHRQLVVVREDGRMVHESVLDAGAGAVGVDLVSGPPAARNAWSFVTLGVHHILSGYDHLVFLAGLILAASTLRALLIGLTAFTAAHSVSLSLVVVGGVHAPPSIVEPLIAASIAWIGIENLLHVQRRGRWWIVFGFGLVHGFGFAGALVELGFGSSARDVALALLSFNGGVEAGQLAVVAATLPLVRLLQSRPAWRATLVPACSVLIVAAGGYWLVERLW